MALEQIHVFKTCLRAELTVHIYIFTELTKTILHSNNDSQKCDRLHYQRDLQPTEIIRQKCSREALFK